VGVKIPGANELLEPTLLRFRTLSATYYAEYVALTQLRQTHS
jgi:hypothetical protein